MWIFLASLLFGGISVIIDSAGTAFFASALLAISAIMTFIMWVTPLNFEVPTGKYNPNKIEVRLTDENYIIDASKYKIIETRGKILTLEEVK